jgi:two-component system chemotaxis response regulator CheY
VAIGGRIEEVMMKILIVDDSTAMRKIVQRTIRQAGYNDHEFVEAINGRAALESIEGSAPDIILADWNMPEMSGMELLKALRSKGINIPFGFITSEGTEEMKQRAMAAGASFLISKPFTAEVMAEALKGQIR